MSDIAQSSVADLLRLSAQIVSAHVVKNAVSPDALPGLIRDVYAALASVEQPAAIPMEAPQPAVPIKRSVFPDYIVCLEDGAKMKMLKRYLKVRFNMTPEQYRERWNLPRDYPMVAPNYAERRSTLAKEFGLGRKAEVEPAAPAKKRGRAAKA
jgi:predicted transcriptional regulator